MIRTRTARHSERDPEDCTVGCGQPPAGVSSGRVCAGAGSRGSCQTCPYSPTYWRLKPGEKPAPLHPDPLPPPLAMPDPPEPIVNECDYVARPSHCDACGADGARLHPAGWRCGRCAP